MAVKTITDSMLLEAVRLQKTRERVLEKAYKNFQERVGEDPEKQKEFVTLVSEVGKIVGEYFYSHGISYGDGLVVLDALIVVHTKLASDKAAALEATRKSSTASV